MCSLSQVRLLTVKRPPRPQPSTTTAHPATTWTPSCSSSARWPGRGTSSVSVWRWHRPGPPSTTAGANPVLPAKLLLLLFFFFSPPSGNTFIWLLSMNLPTVIIDAFFCLSEIHQAQLLTLTCDSLLPEQQSLWLVMFTLSRLLKSLWCQCPSLWLPCFHLLILCCLK